MSVRALTRRIATIRAARAAIGTMTAAPLFLSAHPVSAECVETAPSGAARPQMVETFPSRGLSGYAATLRVVVTHGRGETVLPRGLDLQSQSDSARELKSAGFALPFQDGGGAARMASADVERDGAHRKQTTLDLPLLSLPTAPGRQTLTLPSLPIAIARANGDIVTLCTKPHAFVVEDPTASTPNAEPRPNPPPRMQREEWVALERGLAWAAAGALVGAILLWLVRLWRLRPKVAPAPPPPRVPWEVAFERLHEVRHAGLLETQRFSEFFDRVNDAVREYLGARFGFEGLESTTDEMLTALRRVPHLALPLGEVAAFLEECDLVKFADVTPTLGECQTALLQAERVVRATMPYEREAAAKASPEVRAP